MQNNQLKLLLLNLSDLATFRPHFALVAQFFQITLLQCNGRAKFHGKQFIRTPVMELGQGGHFSANFAQFGHLFKI